MVDPERQKPAPPVLVDINKANRVLLTCPVCGKKYREGGDEKIILTAYKIAGLDPGSPEHTSFPKVACTGCGVEFFPPTIILELKARAKGEGSKIIVPGGKVKLN